MLPGKSIDVVPAVAVASEWESDLCIDMRCDRYVAMHTLGYADQVGVTEMIGSPEREGPTESDQLARLEAGMTTTKSG